MAPKPPQSYQEALDTAPEARGLVPETPAIQTGYSGLVGDLDPEDTDQDGEPVILTEEQYEIYRSRI